MAEMVRVNTRISKTANEWLDNESAITGIPKSTMILLAIENYIEQKKVVGTMGQLMQKLNDIENKLEK